MAESTRTVLSSIDIHLLAKIAAVVHDGELLDPEATSPQVLDLCRRCSEAIGRGEYLAVAHRELSLLEALVTPGSTRGEFQ